MTKKDDFYESFEYWFESPELHTDVNNYNENYYAYKIYDNIISKLKIPDDGYIVVLGTNNCVSFNLLCDIYGKDRCVGFDLYNPSENDRVITKDCRLLSDSDDMPIAFCHNDMGSYPKTPNLKIHAQRWASKNVIDGGIFLGRNNLNRAKFDNEGLMSSLSFTNIYFSDLIKDFPKVGNILEDRVIEGHMLSIKSKIALELANE